MAFFYWHSSFLPAASTTRIHRPVLLLCCAPFVTTPHPGSLLAAALPHTQLRRRATLEKVDQLFQELAGTTQRGPLNRAVLAHSQRRGENVRKLVVDGMRNCNGYRRFATR
ncbi:hypothetical protein BV25DRAFT_1831020 [Artomyces pyxidatus]|uniref:Uncharacterized protein n=1 Tax=Artomyces pyxidatus TaxID=48021 RepID=A0ACB8SMZ8_9AGAM|nr:hypothetical protein BV25DRAFT_1831020 [Artomyces pyxidatus]